MDNYEYRAIEGYRAGGDLLHPSVDFTGFRSLVKPSDPYNTSHSNKQPRVTFLLDHCALCSDMISPIHSA